MSGAPKVDQEKDDRRKKNESQRRRRRLFACSVSSPYLCEGHHLDGGVGSGRNGHEGDGAGGSGDGLGGRGLRRIEEVRAEEGEQKK